MYDPTGSSPELFAGDSEASALMRAMDWAKTPLGPPDRWPQSLKTCVRIMLTSRQAMFVWWGDQLINLYNDAYRAIVGGKHPEAFGQPASVVWREIWDQVSPRAESAMRRNEGTYDEALLLIMERNGYPEETYYTFSYSPVPNDQGGSGGIICANTDDTQRIIGERQLRLLRELSTRVAEARTAETACRLAAEGLACNRHDIPFALVYMLDPQRRALTLHGATGLTPGGREAPEALAIDDDAVWPFAETMRTNQPCVIGDLASLKLALPTGAWDRAPRQAVLFPLAPTADTGRGGVLVVGLNPYRLYGEDYQGFLGLVAGQIAAGIANAQAYEEERDRAEKLAEIDRAKTAFFSNVSHEFRTPLTLMLAPLEDVLNEATPSRLSAAHRERLEVAYRNSLRLLRLVNTLLDFSRIEAGRASARFQPTDLAALTTDLASGFRSAIERAGLTLTIDCPPLPAPVYVDPEMWEKITLNLLSNAFKFTFEGGIEVALHATDDHAVLDVRDTGVGVSAHELPRLFERFHRIEGQRSRSFEGSGIGLSLVQELAGLHGGTIAARSQPDRGTVFTVAVPLGAAHLPADQISGAAPVRALATQTESFVDEALQWLVMPGDVPSPDVAALPVTAQAGPNAHQAADMPRARIVLADDNADMRDYVRRLLAERFEVTAVADGNAALVAVRTLRPELVLSDIMMPGLDGFGLLREIRADAELRDMPVILLSARAGEEARAEGLDAAADDYLTKPFSARELLARVSANLTMARVRREATQALRASEARFRTFAQAVPNHAWAATPQGEFDWVNDRVREYGGTAPSVPIAAAWEGLIHPDDRAAASLQWTRALKTGGIFETEIRLRRRDGRYRWHLARGLPTRDAAGHITRWIGTNTDIDDQKAAAAALAHLNETLEQQVAERTRERDGVWRTSQDLFVICGGDGTIQSVNPAWTEALGYPHGDLSGLRLEDFAHPDETAMLMERQARLAEGEAIRDLDLRLRGKDGEFRWYSWHCIPQDGSFYCAGRDVTQRKQLEQQLRQSQKMEAVGQLTGGLAHDFNNLLTGIGGSLELLQSRLAQGRVHDLERYIAAAQGAAKRAAALTHRLLAFSRQQTLDPRAIDINRLVGGMAELISRTAGPAVSVGVVAAERLWTTLVDPNQLENALLNLCLNGRDAMPDGGRLTIETANRRIDEIAARRYDVPKGEYVALCVTDTGTGMTRDVIARAFDPFFTTKPLGMGTGLGLSMIYGFARQSGGEVRIQSQVGEGTTVCLYLPRHTGPAETPDDGHEQPQAARSEHGETVLVVDDEPTVRMLVTDVLDELGYIAAEAKDGQAGLEILRSDARIDLMVTDVGLPGGMNGRELAQAARLLRPGLKVLFITGFAENALLGNVPLEPDMHVLTKPFGMEVLASRIRDLIAG